MEKKSYVLIAIVAVVALLVLAGIGSYNGIVDLNEKVDQKQSDVEVQLQRRADLIPNIVKTVQGYVKHEDEVIEKVTEARQNLVNAKSIGDKSKANDELSIALNNLFVIVENYPELKSSENFKGLQDELAGTENRIAIARKEYNDAVSNYNKKIKKFPTKLFANIFNFDEKEYITISEEQKSVPEVNFD